MHTPLLSPSYFPPETLSPLLPTDLLQSSRGVLNVLVNLESFHPTRIDWGKLPQGGIDGLVGILTFLSEGSGSGSGNGNGTRPSLTASDLRLLGSLPLFETVGGGRVSLGGGGSGGSGSPRRYILEEGGGGDDAEELLFLLPEASKDMFLKVREGEKRRGEKKGRKEG